MRRAGPIFGIALVLASCVLVMEVGCASEEVRLADAGSRPAAVRDGAGDAFVDPIAPDGGSGTTDCPQTGGPSIRVQVGAASYCIDATEVTRKEYLTFLESVRPEGINQGPACGWNTSFAPTTPPRPGATDFDPIVGIDWCDALAFCTYAGKRLCGAIGGGPAIAAGGAWKTGQWGAACSNSGTQEFPYGKTFDSTACNGLDGGHPVPVKTFSRCEGGFGGLFDLVGNVHEWIDACDSKDAAASGEQDSCLFAGGGFNQASVYLACTSAFSSARSFKADDIGFRCCSL